MLFDLKCERCGEGLPRSANFCRRCGQSLLSETPAATSARPIAHSIAPKLAQPPPPLRTVNADAPPSTGKWVGTGTLVALMILVAVAKFYAKQSRESRPTPAPPRYVVPTPHVSPHYTPPRPGYSPAAPHTAPYQPPQPYQVRPTPVPTHAPPPAGRYQHPTPGVRPGQPTTSPGNR